MKGPVVMGLVLFAAACGTTPRAVTSQTGGPAQPSTIPAQPSTITGLTLTFIATRRPAGVSVGLTGSCYGIVPVPGGFYGRCISGYGSGGDPATGVNLIGNDGVITDLPDPTKLLSFFADGANMVSQETFPEPAPLLVIEPTSWAVKKAIPLPSPAPSLMGVNGTTAILVKSGPRVMAYDLSGAKKWDVPLPDFVKPMNVEFTPAGVLVFEDNEVHGETSATHATMLRLDNGSALWARSDKGLSVRPGRVGRTVFYDNAGVPRSLATGERRGRAAGSSAELGRVTARGRQASIATGAVAYEDDLILSDPLRRITPEGKTVWMLPGTSGTLATDGKTLVVLSTTNELVVLDPATGRRLGQAPDPSPNDIPCSASELIVASPRVVLACTTGTAVYTVSR